MGCLDEVEGCLERAPHSSKACLEGITKADLALRESKGDSDIHCVVMVRRTELLYIAVSPSLSLSLSLSLSHSHKSYCFQRVISTKLAALFETVPLAISSV